MRHLLLALLAALAMCVGFEKNGLAADKGAVTPQDVTKQAQQALDTAKEYTMQQKQEYREKIEAQLADLSKRIDHLKEQADAAKKEAAAKLESAIADLKNKHEVVQKQLPELRSATSKAWGDVKAGLDKAMDDLKQAYDGVKSRLE